MWEKTWCLSSWAWILHSVVDTVTESAFWECLIKIFLENCFHEHPIDTATSSIARIIDSWTRRGNERSIIQNYHWWSSTNCILFSTQQIALYFQISISIYLHVCSYACSYRGQCQDLNLRGRIVQQALFGQIYLSSNSWIAKFWSLLL